MSINSWNLSQTKNHFFIRQRKQAQRKHLLKLKNTKSSIDLLRLTQTSKAFHNIGTRTPIGEFESEQKQRKSCSPGPASESMLSSIVRKVKLLNVHESHAHNLRVSSSLSRIRMTQKIQKQNQKLFTRLIKAKPSISEMELKKDHLNHQKYKENILKNKYLNPDYTKQVRVPHKSFSHLLLKPIQNLNRSKEQLKPFRTRLKPQNKNQFHVLSNLTDCKSTETEEP